MKKFFNLLLFSLLLVIPAFTQNDCFCAGELKASAINVFPNPASHTLKVYNPGEDNLLGRIHSLDGRTMATFDLDGLETKEVKVDMIPNGIYFIKIMNPMSRETIFLEKNLVAN